MKNRSSHEEKQPSERWQRPRWRWLLLGLLLLCVAGLPLSWLAHTGWLAYASDQPYTQEELGGEGVDEGALEALNELRERSGRRWTVVSALRSRASNRATGGASHSQHIHGRAFDLRVPHWARDDFYGHAKQAGFSAFGWGNATVHVDTRSRKKDWWTYDDHKKAKHVSGRKRMDYLYKAPESFRTERGLEWAGPDRYWRRVKWDLIALFRDLGLMGDAV